MLGAEEGEEDVVSLFIKGTQSPGILENVPGTTHAPCPQHESGTHFTNWIADVVAREAAAILRFTTLRSSKALKIFSKGLGELGGEDIKERTEKIYNADYPASTRSRPIRWFPLAHAVAAQWPMTQNFFRGSVGLCFHSPGVHTRA